MSKVKKKQPIIARRNTLYFNFSHKGKTIRSTTGYKVGQEDLAYVAYIQKKKELEDEDNGIQTHRSIQDGLIRWIEEKLPTLSKPEKYKTHLKIIREFIDETKPLSEIYQITNQMISDMQTALKFDEESNEYILRYKNSSVNKKSAILSNIATLAYSKWHWLKESPYKKITKLDEKKSIRETFIETDEVERLSEACTLDVTKDLTVFAAYTGLRTAEIWRLNERSLHGCDLHIDGKGDKLRVIPLNEIQINFIEKYIPLNYSETCLKADFLKARKATGLLHHTFHDLRHTFGTLLAKDGVPQYKIMQLMGHSTDVMVRRYMKLTVEDLRNDMPTRPNPHDDQPAAPALPTKKPKLRIVS